jgi:hypothetical protein
MYADDIVLLATDTVKLQDMVTKIYKECLKIGPKINTNKTKTMRNGFTVGNTEVKIENEEIEVVDKFVYVPGPNNEEERY